MNRNHWFWKGRYILLLYSAVALCYTAWKCETRLGFIGSWIMVTGYQAFLLFMYISAKRSFNERREKK